jgi:hypothetical protein
MKSSIHYLAVLVFVFLITGAVCAQAEENWIELDSYSELEGQWEGSAISTIKDNDFGRGFKSKLTVSITFNYTNDSMFVTSVTGVDFSDFLSDLESTGEVGYTKDQLWQVFRAALDGGTFDGYCVYFESSEPADEFFASDLRGRFFVNDRKDQLLLEYFESSSVLGIGDSGFTKMLFKKVS